MYHISTDGKDTFRATLKGARALIKKWKSKGYVNWRIKKLNEPGGEEEWIEGEGELPD